MFTNKSHPGRGIMSTILGVIAVVALAMAVYLSFQNGGEALPRYGVTALLAAFFSVTGLVLAILARMEKDRYYLFPKIGIGLNIFCILSISFMLYMGLIS